ncbi:TolC family protein [Novosphingobium album (ex Liu et al. 2023)]|uniref:TolC family protein n=1 Tax=Novosphingobium album (ex Liu et al. 2023) TaxID=3031130 RepID=A0ABT5WSX9_9SPHN|nr:TolC family protein [Novosphingobium album (ex Liu et al. 2023)]MDE8653132.1 TolC family protein [Novosphingobium album (ex Liu et al. 2023)]
MRKAILLAAAALTLPAALRAEPGLPDPAAVIAALDAHPSVQAAQARTGAARAEARALARGSHEITLSGSYVNRAVDREGHYDEYDAQLLRAVRLPGKARLDREIGAFGVAAAENRAEDVRHQTAVLLSESWWDWLGAAQEARVDRQAVENYAKLLDAVRRRVALRDAAQLEADQTEALLGSARLAAEQSQGREALARARLAAQFPTLPLPASPEPVPQPSLPEAGLAALGQLVIARSHEIAAADAQASRTDAAARRARADRVADPSLGVRLFSEREGAERGAGVLFSIPLGGGHRQALADQAEAEASAARADVTATHYAVTEMAEGDMALARYSFAAWQRAREGLDAQIAALTKLRLGHKAGEIDLADELLGERQVHDAFRAEAQARTEAMRALTRLRIDSHEIWIGEEAG